MKRAKGTGTVFKLSGNRTKPYVAYVYGDKVFNEEKKTCYRKRTAIGYYETQRQAQQELEKYLSNEYDLTESKHTFGYIWQKQFSKMELSQSRINSYNSTYKKYFGSLDKLQIKDIKTSTLQDIVDECDKSSFVKSNIKSIMVKVFEYAMQNDLVEKDYSQYVKFKKDDVKVVRQVFDAEEVRMLFDKQGNYVFDFYLILLYTGMRPKELVNLTKDNVHICEQYINIDASKTKAGIRVVPIHKDIMPIIESYMSKQGKYLIHPSRSSKITYENFTKRDVPKINSYLNTSHTTYDCRHTFVTHARECGLDFLCIQKIVGHKPTTITEQVYTHISLDELKNQMCKFNY